jgi:hypothetical protein
MEKGLFKGLDVDCRPIATAIGANCDTVTQMYEKRDYHAKATAIVR